ncbi:S-adenosylmethionine decarboxylase [Curvibacter sp. APW13]|uniref:S-adenosylmethionine decarboxylase family protein n=1 Tax=Curvibacter sp. APW13 TaxID=3077236 RepID=UPI0028DD92FD|nr:S-adenosylmethionine decarboxylase [Curvibacter sp. APW13]MDT8990537.1 S-adenosylmethionine decarboxylase [Curvibacter sp. APW13]
MHGLHLTADLFDCTCEQRWLTDADAVLARCVALVQAAGLQPVAQLAHRFPDSPHGPGGITATVLLAESHLCVHTWPETCSATLDVYVCNFGADHSAKAQALRDSVVALFLPQRLHAHALHRGQAPSPD